MIIRPATGDDWQAIAAIWNPVIREGTATFTTDEKTEGGLRERIATAPAFLVAEEADLILGFATYDQFRAGPGYARTMELTIYLAEHAQGRGTGRILLEVLEDLARSAGVASLWAGVGGENPGSVAFHERLGFQRIATLPAVGFKFGRWMDLVLLRKPLH